MNTKYLIEEQTLRDIANSLRIMDGSEDGINVSDYADKICKIEPTVEEYMRISDYLKYPIVPNENDYNEKEIVKCQEFIKFYDETEEIING